MFLCRYEMEPEHVAWSHSKAFSPYKPCMWGPRCEGFNPLTRHLEGEQFPFVQCVIFLVFANLLKL